MPTAAGLTVKERKLVQGVAAGKTRRQAAIDAGYGRKSAHVTATQYLKNPRLKNALAELMDKQGLSEAKLLQPIKDGLSANKVISAETEASTDAPDHAIRLKAAELGWKLRGHLKTGQDDPGPRAVTIVYGHNVAIQQRVEVSDEHSDGS